MDDNLKNKIVSLYTSSSSLGAFGSINEFRRILKSGHGIAITLKSLRDLLAEGVPAVTLEKVQNSRFERRTILTDRIGKERE